MKKVKGRDNSIEKNQKMK